MLSDGHTVFTAGLSSTVAGVTSFRHEDALGSLRFLTDGGQNVLGSSVFEAFGTPVGATGSTAGASFGWVGGADCQTDADTGLVLMGHRYYDSRVGRFLSQDPAGDGDNWYAYCHNSPVNATDPTGLSQGLPWETGALDRRYGGLGGALGGGIGDGPSSDFWGSENDSMERGHQLYIKAEIERVSGELLFDQIAAESYFSFHGFSVKEEKKIKYLIALINTTDVGHIMISRATKSSFNYKITKNKGMQYGNTATGETSFNLDYHPEIYTVGGKIHASSLRILAHELGHSVFGLPDIDSPISGGRKMLNIDVSENNIMTQLAGPGAERTSY